MSTVPARLADIARYYDGKILAFGATALGVDWPSLPSVHTRLFKLLEVGTLHPGTSVNDLGCGWGAALEVIDHLQGEGPVDYCGVDVAPAMIDAARTRWAGRMRARFVVGTRCTRVADYAIASGIFNVKLAHPLTEWEEHVRETLHDMHRHATKGFSVNFMLPSAASSQVPELYCSAPEPWVRFCESLPGRRVQVAQVPGLAEFTLLVR